MTFKKRMSKKKERFLTCVIHKQACTGIPAHREYLGALFLLTLWPLVPLRKYIRAT